MDDYECHGCSTCLNSADEIADGHCPACNLHKNGVVCTPVQAKAVAHMVEAHVAVGEWTSLRTALRRNPTESELITRCTADTEGQELVLCVSEEYSGVEDVGGWPVPRLICVKATREEYPLGLNLGRFFPVGRSLTPSRWASEEEVAGFKRELGAVNSDNWPICPHCRTSVNHPAADYCAACGMPV